MKREHVCKPQRCASLKLSSPTNFSASKHEWDAQRRNTFVKKKSRMRQINLLTLLCALCRAWGAAHSQGRRSPYVCTCSGQGAPAWPPAGRGRGGVGGQGRGDEEVDEQSQSPEQ